MRWNRVAIGGGEMRRRYHDGEGRQPTLRAIRTHDEVAKLMSLSRQRVVQLEQSALRKLRAIRMLREMR